MVESFTRTAGSDSGVSASMARELRVPLPAASFPFLFSVSATMARNAAGNFICRHAGKTIAVVADGKPMCDIDHFWCSMNKRLHHDSIKMTYRRVTSIVVSSKSISSEDKYVCQWQTVCTQKLQSISYGAYTLLHCFNCLHLTF